VKVESKAFLQNLEQALHLEAGSISQESMAGLAVDLDSMGVIYLSSFFDNEIGVVVDPDKLAGCRSVKEIVELIGPQYFA
jgi:acyl carrier protein